MKEQDNIDILGDGLLNEKDQQDAATLAQWEKEHPENLKFYDFLMRIKMPDNIDDKKVYTIDREKALADPRRISEVVSYVLDHFDQKTKRSSFKNCKYQR